MTNYEARWATCFCKPNIRNVVRPDGSLIPHDHFAWMIEQNEKAARDYMVTAATPEVRSALALDPAISHDLAAFVFVEEIKPPAPLPGSLKGICVQALGEPIYVIREIQFLQPPHSNQDIVDLHHGIMSRIPTDTRFAMDASNNSALAEMIAHDGYSVLSIQWTGSTTQSEMQPDGALHVGKKRLANEFDALVSRKRLALDKHRVSRAGLLEFQKELGQYTRTMNAKGGVAYGNTPGSNNFDDLIAAAQMAVHVLRHPSNGVSVQYFGEGGKGPGSLFWEGGRGL